MANMLSSEWESAALAVDEAGRIKKLAATSFMKADNLLHVSDPKLAAARAKRDAAESAYDDAIKALVSIEAN